MSISWAGFHEFLKNALAFFCCFGDVYIGLDSEGVVIGCKVVPSSGNHCSFYVLFWAEI